MSKILVIGIDSLLGRRIAAAAASLKDSVAGTSRRQGSGWIPLDLERRPLDLAGLPVADIAFLCASMTELAACRAQPARARLINVEAQEALARHLAGQGTRVVFLSSNAVFSGEKPMMRADQATHPKGVYGKLKAEAEQRLLAVGERVSVVRLTKVLTRDSNPFGTWAARLGLGEPIQAFRDAHLAPIEADEAARALLALGKAGESGIFQVSASRDISYFEAARCLADAIAAPADLVEGVSVASQPAIFEQMNVYSSLDASRLERRGIFSAPDPVDVLRKLYRH